MLIYCDNLTLFCVPEDIKPEQRGKGGPLLIHFDGWTSRYDYWAEEDSDDLHPIGYMEEVGHKDRKNRSDLQAPNSKLFVSVLCVAFLVLVPGRQRFPQCRPQSCGRNPHGDCLCTTCTHSFTGIFWKNLELKETNRN